MPAALMPLPRNVLDAIRDAGVDPATLARRLGIDPPQLETGIGFAQADAFMGAAWQALGDPAFGLRAGTMLRPERFSVVGIAAMASPDLGEALRRKARYNRLIWGDFYELVTQGGQTTVRVAPAMPPRPYSQARIDLELASLLTFSRMVTGQRIQAVQVLIRQPAPSYRDMYRHVFGCPVSFDCQDDAIVFDSRDMARPLVSENSQIGAVLVEAAEGLLDRVAQEHGDGLRQRVAQSVHRLLRGGEPTLAAVASELFMSERTLQRKLSTEGLRFTDVLDEVRQQSALDYLRRRRITVDEVAFLLGFATPTSFFRAFKRWTGQTPEAWRRAMVQAA